MDCRTGDARVRALDGVRALAIGLVLANHAGVLPGGGLGVDLFFALSGFLITRLLATEWTGNARIDLREFYRRRAARLLPALFAMVSLFVLLGALAHAPARLFVDAAAGVSYVGNFVEASGFTLGPFGPLWSLAQEEQFYLVWPFVLVALLRRRSPRTVALIAALGAAGFAVERAALALAGASLHRLWFAPDTHADALLLGCAAGVVYTFRLLSVRQSLLLPALTGVLAVAAVFDIDNRLLYLGPMAAFAVMSALLVLVLAESQTSLTAQLLAAKPLVFVGKISYAIYLWHLPLFALAGPLVGTPLAFAAAIVSWRYVEQPARRRVRRRLAHVAVAEVAASPAAG